MNGDTPRPLEIFFSYAREDEQLCHELEKHLDLLRRQGHISNWYDRFITPGTDWSTEIDRHLTTADIILLLVSPDFLYSEYCYGVEMKCALERHKSGEARVIPIILRPVYNQGAPFSKLQMLPSDRIPITRWSDRDEAFVEVVRGIRKVIKEMQTPPLSPITSLDQSQTFNFFTRQPSLSLLKIVGVVLKQGGGSLTRLSKHKNGVGQKQMLALSKRWILDHIYLTSSLLNSYVRISGRELKQ